MDCERFRDLRVQLAPGGVLLRKELGLAVRLLGARSAMAEAATQFHKGLDQLALLPDGPKRQHLGLATWRGDPLSRLLNHDGNRVRLPD